MFRHCVMFRWKADVGAAHKERVAAGLDELAEMDVVRSYRHGPDAGLSEGNFDYAVVAEFDDQHGWQVYRDDPGHQKLITELIAPYVAERAAVQFESDG